MNPEGASPGTDLLSYLFPTPEIQPMQSRQDRTKAVWRMVCAAALAAGCHGTAMAAQPPADAAAAQAEFAAASKEMKDLVGELTVLQAMYQQPKADKAAVFAGWREMNDYMRENKVDTVSPQVVPSSGLAKSGEDAKGTKP